MAATAQTHQQAGPKRKTAAATFITVHFPGHITDTSRLSAAASCVRVGCRGRASGSASTSSAGLADVELRFFAGVKGVKSQQVSKSGETLLGSRGSRGAGGGGGGKKRLLVIRAKKKKKKEDENGKGTFQAWEGEVIGVVEEEHRFVKPMDAFWPEGRRVTQASNFISNLDGKGQESSGQSGGREKGQLPEVVPEQMFGSIVHENVVLHNDSVKRKAFEALTGTQRETTDLETDPVNNNVVDMMGTK